MLLIDARKTESISVSANFCLWLVLYWKLINSICRCYEPSSTSAVNGKPNKKLWFFKSESLALFFRHISMPREVLKVLLNTPNTKIVERFQVWEVKILCGSFRFPTVEAWLRRSCVVTSLSNDLVFTFWLKWPATNTWYATPVIHPSSCSSSKFSCPSFLWIICSTNLCILWKQTYQHEYRTLPW